MKKHLRIPAQRGNGVSQRGVWQRFIFLALFALCSTVAMAQGKISGNVTDEAGNPVIGASVIVKGTSTGSVTDFDGNFEISNVKSDATLVISYIGYVTQEVALNGRSSVNVTIQEDKKVLDEVVVVGYGVQKRSDVTGAMTSVTAEDLTSRPIANALEGMQGKAAGVDIRTSDRPGEMGDVYIRGVRSLSASSAPLYVVDGVPLNGTVGRTHEISRASRC